MSFTIGENYLIKALDAYPFNMELVAENLGYALSYDDENDTAWTLHGKVMLYHLKDELAAEESFLQALSLNRINQEAMSELLWMYINQARYKEAAKVINQAKEIRGADLAVLLRAEAVIYEHKQKLSKSIESLKEAMIVTYNKKYENYLKDEIKRIKGKRKRLEKEQRKNQEKQVVEVEEKKRNFSLLRLFF